MNWFDDVEIEESPWQRIDTDTFMENLERAHAKAVAQSNNDYVAELLADGIKIGEHLITTHPVSKYNLNRKTLIL